MFGVESKEVANTPAPEAVVDASPAAPDAEDPVVGAAPDTEYPVIAAAQDARTGRTGRPSGVGNVLKKCISEHSTKKNAIAAGKEFVGTDTKLCGSNKFKYIGICARHPGCGVMFWVFPTEAQKSLPSKAADYEGTWGVYVLATDCQHSVGSLPHIGSGVSRDFRTELEMHHSAGMGAQTAQVDLKEMLRKAGKADLAKDLPDVAAIQGLVMVLHPKRAREAYNIQHFPNAYCIILQKPYNFYIYFTAIIRVILYCT